MASSTYQKSRIDDALSMFDLDYDDLVIEKGENWVEKYYIKQIKKCHLKFYDGFKADLKSLVKDSPPDYSIIDEEGNRYYFNVCRNTIMTCNGRDDNIAVKFNKEGRCVAALGKLP